MPAALWAGLGGAAKAKNGSVGLIGTCRLAGGHQPGSIAGQQPLEGLGVVEVQSVAVGFAENVQPGSLDAKSLAALHASCLAWSGGLAEVKNGTVFLIGILPT